MSKKNGAADEQPALGLRLDDGLPEATWWNFAEEFGRERNMTAWRIGDWLVFAAKHYDGGEEKNDNRYGRAAELTGYSIGTLYNRASVARRFDVSRRRETLSFEHHAAVASKNHTEQDRWLAKTAKNGWSVRDLKRHMSEANKPKASKSAEATEEEEITLPITFRGRDVGVPEGIQRLVGDELAVNAWCVRHLKEAFEKEQAARQPKAQKQQKQDASQRELVAA